MNTGRWIGASRVLGRDVRTDEPYPHICGNTVTGVMSGRPLYIPRKSCAACAQEAFNNKTRKRTTVEKGH